MPSRPTTERRFATAANKVNRLFNSRVYVPTGTLKSPMGVIRLRDWFPSLKVRIWCLKAKSALKVCTVCGIPKITIGITGFALGRGDGIEEPYWVSPNCMSWLHETKAFGNSCYGYIFPSYKGLRREHGKTCPCLICEVALTRQFRCPQSERELKGIRPLGTQGIDSITHRINLYPQGIKQLFLPYTQVYTLYPLGSDLSGG